MQGSCQFTKRTEQAEGDKECRDGEFVPSTCKAITVAEEAIATFASYYNADNGGLIWITRDGIMQARAFSAQGFGAPIQLAHGQQQASFLNFWNDDTSRMRLSWRTTDGGRSAIIDATQGIGVGNIQDLARGTDVQPVHRLLYGTDTGIWSAPTDAPAMQLVQAARPALILQATSKSSETRIHSHVLWVDNARTKLMIHDSLRSQPQPLVTTRRVLAVSPNMRWGTSDRIYRSIAVATTEGVKVVNLSGSYHKVGHLFGTSDVTSMAGTPWDGLYWTSSAGHIYRHGKRLSNVQDAGASQLVQLDKSIFWINGAGQLRGVTNALTCAVE